MCYHFIHFLATYGKSKEIKGNHLETAELIDDQFDQIKSTIIFTKEDGSSLIIGKESLYAANPSIMIRSIINREPDVIFIFRSLFTIYEPIVTLVSKITGAKIVLRPDQSYETPTFYNSPGEYAFKKVRYQLADKIQIRTEKEREHINKIGVKNSKLFKAPNHSGINKLESKEEPDYQILSVSGWWKDVKNLHTAIQVFSKVIDKTDKNVRFKIVGRFAEGEYCKYTSNKVDGAYKLTDEIETGEEYKKKIENIIESYNLNNRVEFVGTKTGDELLDIYRNSRIYYMPTKKEGFPSTYVEAYSTGTPVVGLNVPIVNEIIADNKTGFLTENQSEQVKAIVQLLEDDDLFYTMKNNAIKEAEKYTSDTVGQIWKSEIEKLLHL